MEEASAAIGAARVCYGLSEVARQISSFSRWTSTVIGIFSIAVWTLNGIVGVVEER